MRSSVDPATNAHGHLRNGAGSRPAVVPRWCILFLVAALAVLLAMPAATAAKGRSRGKAASVTGIVTGTNGAPLNGITVTAHVYDPYTGNLSPVASATTTGFGEYTLKSLPGNTYIIQFADRSNDYVGEYYDDALASYDASWLWVEPGVPLSGIDAVLCRQGVLRGTVTSAKTGEPLGGAVVDVYAMNDWGSFDWVASTTTNPQGFYKAGGLRPGEYRLGFTGPDEAYAYEAYDDAPSIDMGTSVYLDEGQKLTGLDAALDPWASVSGVVTGASGAGLPGITVQTWRRDADGGWSRVGSTTTGEDGAYTLSYLTSGDYRLKFSDPAGQYFAEWYDDAPDRRSADPVVVQPGEDVTGIDARLVGLGAIAGTVTSIDGPLPWGAWVGVYRWSDDWWSYVASTNPGADGSYRLESLLPGEYLVNFEAWPYLTEWYDDAAWAEDGTFVTVGDGQTTPDIDAVLSRGSTVSGRVTNAEGIGIRNVKVTLETYISRYDHWRREQVVFTRDDGSYTATYLNGGTYRIEFGAKGAYFGEWYDDARSEDAAARLLVPRDTPVSGIDAVLETGGAISGRVSGDGGGGRIHIAAYQTDEYGRWIRVADASTDATGVYTVGGLTAGACRLRFSDRSGMYLPEFWDDEGALATADDIPVAWGTVTPGIDAELALASHIEGSVTVPEGGDVEEVRVEAYRSDGDGGWDYLSRVTVDATGAYDLGGLYAGRYRVHFVDTSRRYGSEWWDDAPRLSAADDIDLGVAERRSGVDAALGAAGRVSGTVTVEGEGPLADVQVTAYADLDGRGWRYLDHTTTDALGQYAFDGLATGEYRLWFRDVTSPWWAPSQDLGEYLDEWYDDAATLREADDVSVAVGEETSGVDVALARGGAIAGTVTFEDEATSIDAWVTVYRRDGDRLTYLDSTSTDATGAYRVGTLRSGEYLVAFNPEWGYGYVDEWYDDSPTAATATPVAVTSGATTYGIDAVLGKGAEISGVVTGADGRGLDNVGVYLGRYENGEWQYSLDASTDALGHYSCMGVRAGDYKVEFSPFDDRHAPEFWDDAFCEEDGAVVGVAGGTVVSDIDAQLDLGGGITGTVTDASGRRLRNIEVSAFILSSSGRWSLVQTAWMDDAGAYTLFPLRPGTYRVGFRDGSGDYADEFWDDAGGADTAQDVVVAAGQTVPGIDAEMGPGETLRGTITDTGGRGVMDARVAAYRADGGAWTYVRDVTTEASGAYRIDNLAPGTYRVRVYENEWGADRYLPEWYDDAASLETATDVAVVTGEGAVVDEDLVHRAEIVELASPTHPDQEAWYSSRDVTMQWAAADPLAVAGYGYVLDREPRTPAPKLVETYAPTVDFTGLEDGVWYFHVRGATTFEDWPPGTWKHSWGPTRHYAIHIDGTAPTTKAIDAGGWHDGPVDVTLVADDACSGTSGGAAKTEYRVDGAAEWTEGTEVQVPVRATGEDDGTHTIAFRSTDAAGNVEAEQTVDVLVDTTAPYTDDDADELAHAADVLVTLAATDEGSGVTETWYSLDDGAWTLGTEVLVAAPTDHIGDAIHTIAYYSVDVAGNIEEERSCTVLIDTGGAGTPTVPLVGEEAAPGSG